MKILKKSKIKTAAISLLLIFLLTGVCLGQEITLEEAVEMGLQINSDLQDVRENINSIERELSSIKASEDWQLKTNASYDLIYEDGQQLDDNISGQENSLNLQLNRTFFSGFTLNPQITVTEDDSEADMSIYVSQQVLPFMPTSLSKQYYKLKKDLLKVEVNYRQQTAEKLITWLESYLNLTRMIEKQEIYKEDLKNARQHKEEVIAAEKIGEAGKQEMLTAKLSVKEAEYRLKEINKQVEQTVDSFCQEIGLSDEKNITLSLNSEYITKIKNRVKKLTENHINSSNLIKIAEKNSSQLLINRIEQEVLTRELEWLEKADSPDVNLTGSYSTDQDQFTTGLNVSYDLYDGGQHEIECDNKEAEINSKKEDYNDLLNNMKLELKQAVDNIELSEFQLEKEKISLEKNNYEVEVYRKQFARGLIDYLEYQEKWLESKETELNINTIRDQLLCNKLKLSKLVNIDDLTGRVFK